MRRLFGRELPLRVVIDARMADGVSGGVQQWIIGLASALSKLDDGSEEYLFLANGSQQEWLTPYLSGPCALFADRDRRRDPASPTRGQGSGLAGRPRRFVARLVRRLRRRFGRQTAAVGSPAFSELGLEVGRSGAAVMHFPRQSAFTTPVPSIYQPWDLQHLHLPEFFSPEAGARREATYRAFCNQASLIVVASRWVKDDVCAQYGIDPARVAVVNPPPVTAAYVEPTAEEAARIAARFALPDRFAYYPAQLWGHKNHERLFEALHLLDTRGVRIPLVSSGHLNERHPLLLDALDRLGIRDQVTFLGYVTPTEVKVLYRTASVLVFPSLYEGWGLPIVEAFAEGLPVACSNVTSLPDLVGDAAVVFDPKDVAEIASSIGRIWSDEELRRTLVDRGRERLRLFDWSQTARVMRAHYRAVAGRSLTREEAGLLQNPSAV